VSTTSPQRDAVVRSLRDGIVALRPRERVAVAVDGVDGAGKSVLAAELAAEVAPHRRVLHLTVDGFHRPRAQRYRTGRGPEGFYRDSYDYDALQALVLQPFRAGRPVMTAVRDVATDRALRPEPVPVGADTVLIVDGIFLQRPELAGAWDAAVFVDVPFAVSVPRGNDRFDGDHDPDPEAASNRRYVEGQRLYLADVDPRASATWVVDNTDLAHPVLLSRP
jgi:uridine kinase